MGGRSAPESEEVRNPALRRACPTRSRHVDQHFPETLIYVGPEVIDPLVRVNEPRAEIVEPLVNVVHPPGQLVAYDSTIEQWRSAGQHVSGRRHPVSGDGIPAIPAAWIRVSGWPRSPQYGKATSRITT